MEQSHGYVSHGENMVCNSRKRYTVLSKVHKPDLISSVVLSPKWGFKSTILIIQSLFTELLLIL